jgi:RNA polymerase sigma-70 factor (ECF subfamily)
MKINLRGLYPWYRHDEYAEVSGEMLEAMRAADRQEATYARCARRYNACYSLDSEGWGDRHCVNGPPTPEEIFERKQRTQRLQAALQTLTLVQQRRICAYFYGDMTYRQIGGIEGVNATSVYNSVTGALKKLRKYEY